MADLPVIAVNNYDELGWSLHLIVYMAAYDLVQASKIPDLEIQAVDRDGSIYFVW
jgi:hypothetical protein